MGKGSDEDIGLKIGLGVVLIGPIILCLGWMREMEDEDNKARCAQIQAAVYCQPVRKGSRACFCQREDQSLIPIPEKIEKAEKR